MSAGLPLSARELATRAVRGSMAVAASSYAGFVLSIAGTAAIARYVGPSEFGTYALAQAYAQTLVAFGAFAFTQAVLQSDSESRALADTALAMTLAVRVTLFLVALAVAIPVTSAQGSGVARVFLMLSAVQVLEAAKGGLGMPLQRRLEYGRFAAVNLACSVVGHASGVAAAAAGWGPAALVLRDALLSAVGVAIYLATARRWRLPTGTRLDRDAAKEAWRFGASVYLVRVVDQALGRLDRVVLGALFPLSSIGVYQQARYVASLPSAAVAPGNLSVAIGAYSRLRGDSGRLSAAFDTVQYFVVRIVPPFALVCAAWPDLLIGGLLGPKWASAEGTVRAMAAFAILLPVLDSYRALMEALREWRTLRWSSIAQAAVSIAAMTALSRWGAVGAAAGLATGVAAAIALLVLAARRFVHARAAPRYVPVAIALAVALMAAVSIRAALGAGTGVRLAGAAVTVFVYAAALAACEGPELRRRVRYVLELVRGRSSNPAGSPPPPDPGGGTAESEGSERRCVS